MNRKNVKANPTKKVKANDSIKTARTNASSESKTIKWQKQLYFYETHHEKHFGKSSADSSKKKPWLEDDGKALKCWVCQKYPSIADY